MMQSAFGIRGLLWDVCRWTGYDSFQVIRSFQGISTAGTPLTLAPQTHSLQWTRRSDFTSKMAKLGGTKRSCQNLKQHKVTQTLWLIWWFVFLFDVYILWVCICLLCYTLTCLYIYIYICTYMMSAFLSSGSWGTVGDVSCWCFAMSKGKTGWHGTVHVP